MFNLAIPCILACALIGGCINDGNNNHQSKNAYAVVIGMERSKFAGECSGAQFDSERMYKLISNYAKATLLQSENATKDNVRKTIEEAIARSAGGLFILYYSGHGGSSPFADTGIEELDGRDEYLCLYDTYMRDNEIWSIISKSKGRVFLIFDACHTKTMFRHPNITFTNTMPLSTTTTENGGISMQCWSGCPDDSVSYGSSTGGQFTNALLKYFKSGITYDALWARIEADNDLRKFETVQRTLMGIDFGKVAIFR